MPTPVYTVAGALSWPVMRGLFRLRTAGVENVPEGGVVLAANHTSNFDPWPLGFPLWPRRQLYFMAKVELFNPVLKPILVGGGAFPVRRGESDVQAVETAVRLCREGKIVAMFPEGTRQQKGLRKRFDGPTAQRVGPHRARRRGASRPGCDQGHRPAAQALHGCGSRTGRRSRSTTWTAGHPGTPRTWPRSG